MKKDPLNLSMRPAHIADLVSILELFVCTIESACKQDYTQAQITAWTSSAEDKGRWENRIKNQYFLLAEADHQIVGFASLENGRHVDLMFVHKDHLGKGIANRLLFELEKESYELGVKQLSVDASITARPFFEKQGYHVARENKNVVKGIEIVNFTMLKEK